MQSSFQDWSLLVVDDEPDTLQLIQDYMNIIGVKTYLADNGYTAIEMLETLRPTCILMDISMPEINGFDTLAAIRADASIPYIPVIAVTANVGRIDKHMVMDHGFDGFIAKPFDLQRLLRDIQFYIDKRAAAA
jgi:CheY-like chemotaxis protein